MNFRGVFAAEPQRVVVVRGRRSGTWCEIPSFVESDEYAANFSKQWLRFRDTQLDSANGTSISRDFLERLLGQPVEAVRGKTVLEVGAGTGRFTEHLVRHAWLVVAVDLSEGIFVNAALGSGNLIAAQADLLSMPPMRIRFDLVLCRGVLQHTPNPRRAIELLHQWAAETGTVVFDVYRPGRLGRLEAKYLWRALVQRFWRWDQFAELLDRCAEPMLRTRWLLKRFLPGKTKRLLDYVLPVWDYKGVLPLSEQQLVEWAKLDTLDAMFARYDEPLSYPEVLRILNALGHRIRSADPAMNFFRTQPAHSHLQTE